VPACLFCRFLEGPSGKYIFSVPFSFFSRLVFNFHVFSCFPLSIIGSLFSFLVTSTSACFDRSKKGFPLFVLGGRSISFLPSFFIGFLAGRFPFCKCPRSTPTLQSGTSYVVAFFSPVGPYYFAQFFVLSPPREFLTLSEAF